MVKPGTSNHYPDRVPINSFDPGKSNIFQEYSFVIYFHGQYHRCFCWKFMYMCSCGALWQVSIGCGAITWTKVGHDLQYRLVSPGWYELTHWYQEKTAAIFQTIFSNTGVFKCRNGLNLLYINQMFIGKYSSLIFEITIAYNNQNLMPTCMVTGLPFLCLPSFVENINVAISKKTLYNCSSLTMPEIVVTVRDVFISNAFRLCICFIWYPHFLLHKLVN